MYAGASSPPGVQGGRRWEDRWDILKPTIEFFYLDKNFSVSKLARHMKDSFDFDAVEHQYKHQFKKWGLRKNIRAKDKTRMERMAIARSGLGRSTVFEYHGRKVDPGKIRRHTKSSKRQEMVLKHPVEFVQRNIVEGIKLAFGDNFFLDWKMPYGLLQATKSLGNNVLSPFQTVSPHNTVIARTPSDVGTPSKGQDMELRMVTDITKRIAIERSQFLVQGNPGKLLDSLTRSDAKIMSNWFHQFWLFGFATVKYWGYGPRAWTAQELRLNEFGPPQITSNGGLPIFRTTSGESPKTANLGPSSVQGTELSPDKLCRWTIHIRSSDERKFEPQWDSPWPSDWTPPPIQEVLLDALEHNAFSSVEAEKLPIAIPCAIKRSQRQSNELLLEAFGFAIMTSNFELIPSMCRQILENRIDTSSIYPLHLAINYLDGGKGACCTVLEQLLDGLAGKAIHELYINDKGYRLLDNLLMAILKSHTDLGPFSVDETNKETCFPGDDMSICGRWDPGSDCVRELRSRANLKIPFTWKHKFCHTSIQTICHCMHWIFQTFPYTATMKKSGLFVRRCTCCGLKMQLSNLHALVFTTFLLAEYGCEDENLFGMIAYLLCLSGNLDMEEFEENLKVEVSFPLLMGEGANSTMEACTHWAVSLTQFAQGLRLYQKNPWSDCIKTGWDIFFWILIQFENRFEEMGEHTTSAMYGIPHRILSQDDRLVTIWAAVQTELLTYRRCHSKDPWMSENFDMQELWTSLSSKGMVSIGLIDKGLMRLEVSPSHYLWSYRPLDVDDVSETEFSNLEGCGRALYIVERN